MPARRTSRRRVIHGPARAGRAIAQRGSEGRPASILRYPAPSAMPKMKTHSGAKKRFKLTAKGKVRGRHAYSSHILEKKSP
ncbi:MAG TPA: 50S ribosomal protein L35, partial [Solirubrobacteraceae bacterium]